MRGNLEHNNVTPEMLAQLPFIEGELQVIMTRGKRTGLVYKLYYVSFMGLLSPMTSPKQTYLWAITT